MARVRASRSGALPGQAADIVFLGDSITGYGLWSEWFPGHRVVNHGIAGDTSGGVLGRIGTVAGRQRAVSLLIGTNDLSIGISPDRITANIAAILSAIRAAGPGTRILVNSVMPRTRAYRARIIALNQELASLAGAEGAAFLDLWPALADDQGAIRPGLSSDQVHLTRAGYAAWVEVLREHVPPA
jgi:lysophospholipase L1-like esterase